MHSVRALARPAADAGWAGPGGVALALLGVGTLAWLAGAPAGPRLAVLLVLAPLAEETVFRAGLHESLLRRGLRPFTANLATALAFGLAHVAVQRDLGALMVVAPALLLGVLYQRRRALAPCIVLHALMNALWLAFVLAHPWPPASQS